MLTAKGSVKTQPADTDLDGHASLSHTPSGTPTIDSIYPIEPLQGSAMDDHFSTSDTPSGTPSASNDFFHDALTEQPQPIRTPIDNGDEILLPNWPAEKEHEGEC